MKDSSPREVPADVDVAEKNAVAADFLHSSGLLFELNRCVLHPLGLALALAQNDDGTFSGFGGLVDNSDDPDGMTYSEEILRSGLARLRAYGVAEVRAERARRIGFVVQPLPEEP
jgi:hypothetical protein